MPGREITPSDILVFFGIGCLVFAGIGFLLTFRIHSKHGDGESAD